MFSYLKKARKKPIPNRIPILIKSFKAPGMSISVWQFRQVYGLVAMANLIRVHILLAGQFSSEHFISL